MTLSKTCMPNIDCPHCIYFEQHKDTSNVICKNCNSNINKFNKNKDIQCNNFVFNKQFFS